jgi:hypothetical protein
LVRALEGLKKDCQGAAANPPPNNDGISISNHFDFTLHNNARKLKRSSVANESRVTETFMDDVQDEFGDWDMGVYHKPVVVTNNNAVEIMNCAKIESMM